MDNKGSQVADALVAITGATGFVGRALVARLLARGEAVRGAVRGPTPTDAQCELVQVGAVDGSTDWREALAGADSVIHLAARTHSLGERGGGSLADYRSLNVEGTRRLAESAAETGVRRLVFLSSIKVNGERTFERPFTAWDPPAPEDAYGISKWEAEQALAEVSARTGLETVVLRPPLVYGPGVRANFARLIRGVQRGVPLPLGAVNNRRSLVGLDNLLDLLLRCVEHPAAAGQTFLVSDGEDLSTPELIRRLARAMERRARLFPLPLAVLRMAGQLTGRSAEMSRLLTSLQVDIEHTRDTLDWSPPVSVDEGLKRAVAGA